MHIYKLHTDIIAVLYDSIISLCISVETERYIYIERSFVSLCARYLY